jgi:hypothetical protein
MHRAVRVALCVAAIACGCLASSATIASATGCPSTRFCVWKDNGYVTAGSTYNYFGFTSWSVDYSAHNYLNTSTNVNDTASSWENHGTTNYARVFKDSYYNGEFSGPKAPGSSTGDMVDSWNDTLSSACFISGTNGWCIGP